MRVERANMKTKTSRKPRAELLAAPLKELFWVEPEFGLLEHARERLDAALQAALSQPLAIWPAENEFVTAHQDPVRTYISLS